MHSDSGTPYSCEIKAYNVEKEHYIKVSCNLQCGQFDELLHQGHSLGQVGRRHDLRHDPVLDFVEAPYENVQIRSYLQRDEGERKERV